MDFSKLVEQCAAEEAAYQFDSFSQTQALELGTCLYKKSLELSSPVAIEIRINHLLVFCFYPDGTNGNNTLWLRAKANTVDMVQISSLHNWAQLNMEDRTPADARMPEEDFAFCGGGFPLIVKNAGVIGTICVSGLPHLEDHKLIVDTLKDYFGK